MSTNLSGYLIDDRYQLIKKIGGGGFGTVYLAVDRKGEQISDNETFYREVAVKILDEDKIPPNQLENFRESFKREARIASTLQHPNIVKIYDFGVDNNIYYIVMELLQGGTLSEWLEAKRSTAPITVAEANTILQKIAAAINFAHTEGYIHRDIKPNNIMFDENDNVYVGDFGIAKFLGDVTSSNRAQSSPGTWIYMAPEQRLGQAASPLTDQWSLAFVAHEMLSGEYPRQHGNTTSSINTSAIPPQIRAVLDKALEQKPRRRYRTIIDFAAAFNDAVYDRVARPLWLKFVLVGLIGVVFGIGILFTAQLALSMLTITPTPTRVALITALPTTDEPTSAVPPTTQAPTTVVPIVVEPTTAIPTLRLIPTTVEPRPSASPTRLTSTTVVPTTVEPRPDASPTRLTPTTVVPTTVEPTTTPPPTRLVPTTVVPTITTPSLPTVNVVSATISPDEPFDINVRLQDGQNQKFEVIRLPDGCFEMASDEIECIDMARLVLNNPVTNAQYFLCFDTGPCSRPAGDLFDPTGVNKNEPVLNVTGINALRFCDWLGGRLITEREWEYARQYVSVTVKEWTATLASYSYSNYNPDDGREELDLSNSSQRIVVKGLDENGEVVREDRAADQLSAEIGFRCVMPS